MKTAYSQSEGQAPTTIKGFDVMHMFKKGQFNVWLHGNKIDAEIRLIRPSIHIGFYFGHNSERNGNILDLGTA